MSTLFPELTSPDEGGLCLDPFEISREKRQSHLL